MLNPNRRLPVYAAAALPLAALTSWSLGQCPSSKLLDPDRAAGDQFGYAIDMSQIPAGNAPSMLIGSWAADTQAGLNAGVARVIHRGVDGWTAYSNNKILPDDPQAGDYFGASVGYHYPWAAVGATGVGGTGAGYVFYAVSGPVTWWQVSKLTPAGAAAGDDIGRSIDVTDAHGGWVVLGSPGRDADFGFSPGISDPDAGVAYLYRFTGGAFQLAQTIPERIAAIGGAWANDRFGASTAIADDVVVCGAPGATTSGPSQHGIAAVYMYLGNGAWGSSTELVAPDAAAADRFGFSVATDGVSIIVGAPFDDLQPGQVAGATAKDASGCAYIYRRVGTAWQLDGQVFAPDPTDDARFGSSVAIDGNRAVIGAPGAKRAYLFRRLAAGNWVVEGGYSDPDDAAAGGFAYDVSLAVDELGVADPTDDPSSSHANAGAAYAFEFPASADGADTCAAAPTISGHGQYSGCTTFATLAGSSTCGTGGAGQGPDIWYRWTPACSGPITLDTFGSDFDTVLSVHSGCPGEAANTLQCNDDAAVGLQSFLTFNAAAGQTVLIRVAGYSGARGLVTLNITEGAAPSNDTCNTAQTIASGVHTFSTCRAATNVLTGSACMTGATIQRDLWYRYTAPCTGPVTIDTCGSSFDTVIQVFPGASCPSANSSIITCNDDAATPCPTNPDASGLSFQATAGVSYLIQIGSRPIGGSPPGDGVLSITCGAACPCDWNQSGLLSVQDIFDFLASFFSAGADFNASGTTTVQDLFDFLACYFGGCP